MLSDERLLDGYGGRLKAAFELALLAGDSTLEFYQTDRLTVERKGDNSPVTIADRHAEQLVRARLAELYPDDAVLGEEFGGQTGSSEFQWIVDPIDGTKSFITGVPLYSTLLALVHAGSVLAGVVYIPPLREYVLAIRGRGAWWSVGGQTARRASVSQRPLAEGIFVTSQVDSFRKRNSWDSFLRMEQAAYVTRTWGDGYGYLLVATGRAEVMVDPIANPWDLAAAQAIVTEAGGTFTSWSGSPSFSAGDGVGSNGQVHAEVLTALGG